MTPTQTEQTPAEPVSPTAEIIQFPVREPAPPVVVTPQERLTRALEMLNTALTEQRTAIAAWRGALADLKVATSSLGDSLQRYRGSMQTLGEGVSSLHIEAKALENWAERMAPTKD